MDRSRASNPHDKSAALEADHGFAAGEVAAETAPLPPAAPASDSDEAAIVVTTSLGHFLCHFGELIFPSVMLTIMAEFSLQRNEITWIPLLGYMLMGAGAMPFGMWADAWNPRKILLLYFILMSVSGFAVAAAPNILLLFVALTALGLALSIYHPVGIAMISLGVRARGRALGINGVAGSVGLAMAPLVASGAILLGSWRFAYLIFAVLSAVSAIAFFLTARDAGAAPAPVSATPALPSPGRSSSTRPYLALGLLLLVMMLGGLNYRSLVTALPPLLAGDQPVRQARLAASSIALAAAPNAGPIASAASLYPGRPETSLTVSKAGAARSGWYTFLILLAGGIGQILGGWLADRFGARRVYALLVFLLIPLGILIAVVGGTIVGVVLACCLAIGLFGQQPVENSLLAEYTSIRRRSRSYALKFVLTFGIGAFGAVIVGHIWQETNSLNPVFLLIAGSALVMVVLLAIFHTQVVRQPCSPAATGTSFLRIGHTRP